MKSHKPILSDVIVAHFDRALKTLLPHPQDNLAAVPGSQTPESDLTDQQRQHVAGLMRINHTGEVCAQGLYQGQALTASLTHVYQSMETAADEEIAHLMWCDTRLKQLEARPSLMNPLWYAMSYSMGALAGLTGDQYSLGFVAATEEKVCEHLERHLEDLPEGDHKTRLILQQMLEDEARHATQAIAAGGKALPEPIKALMAQVARVMTTISYRL
jgi:ubiquinone biosynthesis monooxygenase Coq7